MRCLGSNCLFVFRAVVWILFVQIEFALYLRLLVEHILCSWCVVWISCCLFWIVFLSFIWFFSWNTGGRVQVSVANIFRCSLAANYCFNDNTLCYHCHLIRFNSMLITYVCSHPSVESVEPSTEPAKACTFCLEISTNGWVCVCAAQAFYLR